MEFIHGDILDKNLIKKHCQNADVVHHLAGVTDVPRTKSESSLSQDKKIKEVGEIGTQNILDVISKDCKIIFHQRTLFMKVSLKLKKTLKRKKLQNLYYLIRHLKQ